MQNGLPATTLPAPVPVPGSWRRPKTVKKKPPYKPAHQTPPAKKKTTTRVTVRSGQTLSSIATRHHLSLAHLKKLNPALFNSAHRGGNLIHPGEKVRVR